MSRLPVPGIPIEAQPDDILLAMLVWGEARGEGDEGRAAVAWVAKNRALKRDRPIRRVILAPYAFSAFNSADPNRVKMLDPLEHDAPWVWVRCYTIAQDVLSGAIADPTNGATHYTTSNIWGIDWKSRDGRPPWHSKQCIDAGITVETARIGNHVFGVTP